MTQSVTSPVTSRNAPVTGVRSAEREYDGSGSRKWACGRAGVIWKYVEYVKGIAVFPIEFDPVNRSLADLATADAFVAAFEKFWEALIADIGQIGQRIDNPALDPWMAASRFFVCSADQWIRRKRWKNG